MNTEREAAPVDARDRSAVTLLLAVWVCTLPVVLLLTAPFLGLRAALVTAIVLFAVIAVVGCGVRRLESAGRARRARPGIKRT